MGWDRNQMAARAAQELADGTYVNLGIGIPERISEKSARGTAILGASRTATPRTRRRARAHR